MSEFEKNLTAMLQGANDEYRQASADLHQEVAAASESVSRLTLGNARLTLKPAGESPAETAYALWLETLPPDPGGYNLGTIRVPSTGYPLSASTNLGQVELADRRSITTFFENMAGRKDSALVLYMAFVARRRLQKQP
jgi:hypothetical protein